MNVTNVEMHCEGKQVFSVAVQRPGDGGYVELNPRTLIFCDFNAAVALSQAFMELAGGIARTNKDAEQPTPAETT